MELIAAGRDADVFAYGQGRVLRRYRDGRSAEPEAGKLRGLAALGYPVPVLHAVEGPDLVQERVLGPTLAEQALAGDDPASAGRTLAALHDRLHALPWPDAPAGECLLHLDLHPLNVIAAAGGPVVIDWSNAGPGPAGLDVAMTALVVAQVVVTPGVLVQVMPGTSDDAVVRGRARRLLEAFAREVDTPYAEHLAAAEALRRDDPHQSDAERHLLGDAVRLAATVRS